MRELACSSTDGWVGAGRVIYAGQVVSEVPDKDRLGFGLGADILASLKLSCLATSVTGSPSPGKRSKRHRKEVKHVPIVTTGLTVLSICGSYYTFKLQRYGIFHDGQLALYPCSSEIITSLKRRAIILPVLSTEGVKPMNLLVKVYCFTVFIQAITHYNKCTKSEQ